MTGMIVATSKDSSKFPSVRETYQDYWRHRATVEAILTDSWLLNGLSNGPKPIVVWC